MTCISLLTSFGGTPLHINLLLNRGVIPCDRKLLCNRTPAATCALLLTCFSTALLNVSGLIDAAEEVCRCGSLKETLKNPGQSGCALRAWAAESQHPVLPSPAPNHSVEALHTSRLYGKPTDPLLCLCCPNTQPAEAQLGRQGVG